MHSRGFTLIELLVVIGILAVLATVTVLVINPVQLFQQARDITRIQDVQTLTAAFNIAGVNADFDRDGPGFSNSCYGQSNQRIFTSVPSDNGESDPTPPSGWTYARVPAASLRHVDGTGWIPVDFLSFDGPGGTGSPLTILPVDPTNTFTSNLYYTYTCGSFEFTARLESTKFLLRMSGDGGDDASVLEGGSDLAVTPARPDYSGSAPSENPPPVLPPPSAGTVTMRSSITQYGITWTFDQEYQTGQFVTGDYWIIGPAQVVSVSPGWDGTKSGSMVNVNPSYNAQALDTRAAGFSESLRATFPLTLNPNESLLSSIGRSPDTIDSKVSTAAVLTALSEIPPSDSFRPAFAGTVKTLYRSSAMQLGLLPALAPPVDTPTAASVLAHFTAPWPDFRGTYDGKQIFSDAMSQYGREIGVDVSNAAGLLLLNIDATEKAALARGVTQVGIDHYGTLISGGGWPPDGGHMHSRKFPILFAGLMLNNSGMLSIGTQYPSDFAYPPVNGQAHFGEDGALHFVTQADIDAVQTDTIAGATSDTVIINNWPGYTLLAGSNICIVSGPGAGDCRDVVSDDVVWSGGPRTVHGNLDRSWTTIPVAGVSVYRIGYVTADIGLAEWGNTKSLLSNPYRTCCTATTWSTYVLAARLLGLKTAWNYPALFGYMDRYMASIGYAYTAFQQEMWNEYRSLAGPIESSSHLIATPSNFAGIVSQGQVNLSWSDLPDEVTYTIERSTQPASGFSVLAVLDLDTTSYVDTSTQINHSYFYRLKAANTSSVSGFTPVVNLLTTTAPQGQGDITTGLAARWRFEGNVNDSVGSTNGWLMYGAEFTAGMFGQGVTLDGQSGYVEGDSAFDFTSEDFSFAMWIKPTGPGTLIYKGNWATNGYFANLNSDGSVSFVSSQYNTTEITNSSAGSIPFGGWSHLVIARLGSLVSVFVNGIDVSSVHANHLDAVTSPNSFRLGMYGQSGADHSYLPAILDDFRVYSRALNSADASLLHATTVTQGSSLFGPYIATLLNQRF
jgi:prepilin-type N-terminal cleavage/methylation domain-containing protein